MAVKRVCVLHQTVKSFTDDYNYCFAVWLNSLDRWIGESRCLVPHLVDLALTLEVVALKFMVLHYKLATLALCCCNAHDDHPALSAKSYM